MKTSPGTRHGHGWLAGTGVACCRWWSYPSGLFGSVESGQHAQREFQNHFKRLFVNKTELVEHIAKNADISKAAATRALDSTITAIRTTLKKGGTVSLVGFGSFAVTKRPARKGRNPRTGEEIKIKAAKVPKFRPGKALKDALN